MRVHLTRRKTSSYTGGMRESSKIAVTCEKIQHHGTNLNQVESAYNKRQATEDNREPTREKVQILRKDIMA